MPNVFECVISEINKLNKSTYEFVVVNKDLSKQALAGQFLHIKCGDKRVLRRPISISDVNGDKTNFVVEIKGEGTKWLCERSLGEVLDVIGPLGNGFKLPKGKVLVVGGGVGVPPLLFSAKSAWDSATAILGFRNKGSMMLLDEFNDVCDEVYVTTDDGSFGTRGMVIEPLKMLLNEGSYCEVLTCGPRAMMKSVAELCLEHDIPCQVSMEERMGCGVGACYVCACKTLKDGAEYMSRVCIDGPVFNAQDVVW